MAQISLHDYLQQINTLLEENRLSEAVAHCRHILKKFPRHVETYRLFGKALLEQQKYKEAVDIFQRVLSADPEDFISHVGLAITHKEKGEVPEAIWHFERAYEMDPYNAAIQEELRGLYAHRDGLRPERINLTRGALARLYFRGHLYQQAAAELRQILSQNGERLDLQTLLAETLWRDDQRVDVVDVCLRILEKIPYCIKANAILAEVWLVTGRSDEAQEYLQRLRMLTRPERAYLDPDSAVGRAFGVNGQIELPEQVLVEELDYIPVAQEFSGETDWVKELGVETEADEEANWLHELGEIDEKAFAEAAASDEDMLDWLREVAVSEDESFEDGEPDETADVLFDFEDEQSQATIEGDEADDLDWLSSETETEEEAAADIPDWLSEVTASAEADMWNLAVETEEEQAGAEEDEATAQAAKDSKAQTPDWIRDVAQEQGDMSPIASWQEEDSNSWMSEPEMSYEYGEGDEVPDWMRGSSSDALPDWLSDSAETTKDEGLPDWLTQPEEDVSAGRAFPESTIEDTVYGLTGEQIPDWLLGSESEEAEDEMAFDDDFEPLEDTDFAAGFDGDFGTLTEDAADEADSEGLPDWLTAPEGSESAELDWHFEEPTEAATDMAGVDDLPDWLIEAQTAAEGTEAAEMEEIPDWLKVVESDNEDEIPDFDFEQAEQSGEALPDWLEQSPELIVGQTDIDQDSLPDWLDGGDREDVIREELLMGNSEEQEKKEPDIPEDLDEAMRWLEELAAEQGADLAELPSLQQKRPLQEAPSSEEGPALEEDTSSIQMETSAEDSGAVMGDDVPDWLKADLSDGDLSAEADLPDWLKHEAASMSDVDWLSLSHESALSDESVLDSLENSAFEAEDFGSDTLLEPDDEDIPDWLKAQMPEDLMSGMAGDEEESEADDLGWLDQIAAGEGAAIEELPTLSWDDEQNEAGLEGGDLSWLDEMAAEEGAVYDTAEPPEVSLFDIMGEPEDTEYEAAPELSMPDDPDEAMAWLEQLAARQGAPLDELPTVVDFEESADIPELDFSDSPTMMDIPDMAEAETAVETPTFEIPDDPDEAMAWLEQLAAQQGAPLEELPSVSVVQEMPTPTTGITMEAEEFEAFDLPELEEDGLDTAIYETADYQLGAAAEEEFDPELEMALAELSEIDMPEDDDEALAWLAAITAGQDTAELVSDEIALSDDSLEDDFSVEDFSMEELLAEDFSVEDFSFDEPEAVAEETAEPSLFEPIEEEPEPLMQLPDDLPVEGLEDSELDSALPEWLQFGPVGEAGQDELDWLDSYGESGVDSWLEAEEETSQLEIEIPTDTAELEPSAFLESQAVEDSEAFEEEVFEVEAAPSGPVDQSQLESARSALEIGDFSTALDQYNSLLQSGQGLPLLIADLESASSRHSNIAPLQRLLGDAYMQNGQLQKAIDIYRQALDNL